MKEKAVAIIITIILIILGLIVGIFSSYVYSGIIDLQTPYNEFNFYSSKLEINGTNIIETLNYIPDKDYHTLFRNFESTITTKNSNIKNSITIESVNCEKGTPYFRIEDYCYTSPDFTTSESCKPYTENNEYGCTFGDYLGFKEGENYKISSNFKLNPENLFKINGKYYIKFIAYGKNNHVELTTGNNLVIKGEAVYSTDYKSNEYVIIYIPFEENIDSYNIIEQTSFQYDATKPSEPSMIIAILIILAHLLPALLFFISWYFFGKELTDESVPEQLSTYPNNRKPWEVAAFFNPPFGKIDKNFFSTMLLDFYKKKIIDLKLVKGFFKQDLMIKINENKIETLDKIETEFLRILVALRDFCPQKCMDGDFFNLNKSGKSYTAEFSLRTKYIDFQKSLSKESKKYLEKKGIIFFIISMVILAIISLPFILIGLFFLSIISLFIVSIISASSSLLIKYKIDFYTEYQKWQSFKKWLKGSPSMKEAGHRGVILWDQYLIYATALGVSKQVLKELKKEKLIDNKKYNFYTSVNIATTSFALSSGSSGGFSGAGGGGVGGGGGGGR